MEILIMIQHLSSCPFCSSRVGFDWHALKVVVNPDSVRPLCEHTVWLVGILRRGFDADCVFNVMRRELFDRDRTAEVRELLDNIDFAESIPADADFQIDMPTLNRDEETLMDGTVVYALHPADFLDWCLENIRSCPRPSKRGPVVQTWGPCALIG